jgi:tetratricopeptide (TPR) repeat protein
MPRRLLLALPTTLWASAALAVLQEERPPDAPPPPSPTTSVCADGEIWDDVTSTCVEPETGALDDDRLYAAARELAYAGRHADALRVLAAMRAQASPRVLAARGYALRKSGRVAEGLALYAAALEADPDFHVARAYRGVYLVETGDAAGARAELAAIAARGGAATWAHEALRRAIAGDAAY